MCFKSNEKKALPFLNRTHLPCAIKSPLNLKVNGTAMKYLLLKRIGSLTFIFHLLIHLSCIYKDERHTFVSSVSQPARCGTRFPEWVKMVWKYGQIRQKQKEWKQSVKKRGIISLKSYFFSRHSTYSFFFLRLS